jgi:endogenous inhibitor of DNA gyrase (YacG/DUF329 family)
MSSNNSRYTEIKPEAQNCSICRKEVDADDEINGVPNCVTCVNGHFIHRQCYNSMLNIMEIRSCPLCKKPVEENCSGYHGYFKPNRKGGIKKKKNTKNKKLGKSSRKRKSNKRYTRKIVK